MTAATARPEKESYVLVSFTYNGSTVRFTNWGSNIDPTGANFVSVPAMEIKLPENTGRLQVQMCKITMPRNADTESFLEPLSRGIPFAPVRVLVEEINRGLNAGDTAQNLKFFHGWLRISVRNPSNRRGFVRLEVESPKANLKKPIGIACNHECENTLYKFPCSKPDPSGWGPEAAVERKLGTLSAIAGKTVTISGSMSLAGSKSYFNGYIERDGARIRIRDWDSGAVNTFHLTQQPPAEWLNQQVAAYPGCNKSITDCRVWGNEDSFLGVGYGIPAFDPTIELPPEGTG